MQAEARRCDRSIPRGVRSWSLSRAEGRHHYRIKSSARSSLALIITHGEQTPPCRGKGRTKVKVEGMPFWDPLILSLYPLDERRPRQRNSDEGHFSDRKTGNPEGGGCEECDETEARESGEPLTPSRRRINFIQVRWLRSDARLIVN